jgi:hypothetical protein
MIWPRPIQQGSWEYLLRQPKNERQRGHGDRAATPVRLGIVGDGAVRAPHDCIMILEPRFRCVEARIARGSESQQWPHVDLPGEHGSLRSFGTVDPMQVDSALPGGFFDHVYGEANGAMTIQPTLIWRSLIDSDTYPTAIGFTGAEFSHKEKRAQGDGVSDWVHWKSGPSTSSATLGNC